MAAEGGNNYFMRYSYRGKEGEVIPDGATHITVGEGVTFVRSYAFYQHPNIVEVICHNGVEKIGARAFVHCPSLRRVIIPGVKEVEGGAFCQCSALTDVECGQLELIKDEAFCECSSLRNIDLLSVRIVERLAFYDCQMSRNFNFGIKLKELDLSVISEYYGRWGDPFGSEGLSALVGALANCTCIKRLNLSGNDFSMATAELRSLSHWLQTLALPLDELRLVCCEIIDEGLQALTEGSADHCKLINLEGNHNITTRGLRFLLDSMQAASCSLKHLILPDIGDDGAEVLARGLTGNTSLKFLHLFGDYENGNMPTVTPAGWSAFIKVLCDTSTINNTYLSNHTIRELWDDHPIDGWWYTTFEHVEEYKDIGQDLTLYLRLNKKYPQHAARCKILMNHKHLDLTPLLRQLEFKCLPLVIDWFERAKPCIALPWYGRRKPYILEESAENFESRILTALYEFVHGAPGKVLERRGELTLVAAYDDKVASLLDDETSSC